MIQILTHDPSWGSCYGRKSVSGAFSYIQGSRPSEGSASRDGAAAMYKTMEHILAILDPEAVKAMKAKNQEKQKDEIKGF